MSGWRRAGGAAFLAVDLCATAALALGAAGRAVPPAVEWRLQLAALALPAATAATAAAAAVWGLRALSGGGKGAWGALAVHLVLVGVVAPRPGGGGASAGADEPLRVLTLNVGKENAVSADRLRTLLQQSGPHIVALQEASVSRGADGDGRRVVAGPVVQVVGGEGYAPAVAPGETSRTPVFSLLPASSTSSGSLGRGDDDRAGAYTRAVVRWEGRDVAVYSVHLRSFNPDRPSAPWEGESVGSWFQALEGLGRDFVLRAGEADRLRALLRRERLPFLVMGDLNSTPHQWAYARVAEGLLDATRAASGWTATYPDRRPLVQIDAVLASPEWDVVSAEVGPPGLSDHRAVIAGLALPRGPSH